MFGGIIKGLVATVAPTLIGAAANGLNGLVSSIGNDDSEELTTSAQQLITTYNVTLTNLNEAFSLDLPLAAENMTRAAARTWLKDLSQRLQRADDDGAVSRKIEANVQAGKHQFDGASNTKLLDDVVAISTGGVNIPTKSRTAVDIRAIKGFALAVDRLADGFRPQYKDVPGKKEFAALTHRLVMTGKANGEVSSETYEGSARNIFRSSAAEINDAFSMDSLDITVTKAKGSVIQGEFDIMTLPLVDVTTFTSHTLHTSSMEASLIGSVPISPSFTVRIWQPPLPPDNTSGPGVITFDSASGFVSYHTVIGYINEANDVDFRPEDWTTFEPISTSTKRIELSLDDLPSTTASTIGQQSTAFPIGSAYTVPVNVQLKPGHKIGVLTYVTEEEVTISGLKYSAHLYSDDPNVATGWSIGSTYGTQVVEDASNMNFEIFPSMGLGSDHADNAWGLRPKAVATGTFTMTPHPSSSDVLAWPVKTGLGENDPYIWTASSDMKSVGKLSVGGLLLTAGTIDNPNRSVPAKSFVLRDWIHAKLPTSDAWTAVATGNNMLPPNAGDIFSMAVPEEYASRSAFLSAVADYLRSSKAYHDVYNSD